MRKFISEITLEPLAEVVLILFGILMVTLELREWVFQKRNLNSGEDLLMGMTFFSLPDCHTPLHRSTTYRRALLESIRRADLVNVPSCSTQQESLELMPELSPQRLRMIPPGVGEEFQPHVADEVQIAVRRLGMSWPYILYVGTIEPRQNLRRLVESYQQLIAEGQTLNLIKLSLPRG